jgi:hypothetical protein
MNQPQTTLIESAVDKATAALTLRPLRAEDISEASRYLKASKKVLDATADQAAAQAMPETDDRAVAAKASAVRKASDALLLATAQLSKLTQ